MAHAVSLSQPSGKAALSVAAFLARPARFLAPDVLDRLLRDVAGRDLRPVLASRIGAGAVERYVTETCGSLNIDVDARLLKSLGTSAPTQTALHLALAPADLLSRLKRYIVGTVCQQEIKSALLKSDRVAIQFLIGAEIQVFASRQAAMFYPELARLAPQAGVVLRARDDTPFETHPANEFASRVVISALDHAAPLAASILRIRERGEDMASGRIELTAGQVAEIMRLARNEASA